MRAHNKRPMPNMPPYQVKYTSMFRLYAEGKEIYQALRQTFQGVLHLTSSRFCSDAADTPNISELTNTSVNLQILGGTNPAYLHVIEGRGSTMLTECYDVCVW